MNAKKLEAHSVNVANVHAIHQEKVRVAQAKAQATAAVEVARQQAALKAHVHARTVAAEVARQHAAVKAHAHARTAAVQNHLAALKAARA
ncbi:MAG TPA: hypothetical protein VGH73_11980 [Thermoanaerobaculia bacterium]